MAITTGDQLLNALANNSSRLIIDKASLANQVAGRYCSMWTAAGQPAAGANPGTTPQVCLMALTGSPNFTPQTEPARSYLAWLFAVASNNAQTLEVHDRIAHVGGLVLNSTALQSISGFSLTTMLLADLAAERLGSEDFSDLQWWLEVYTDGGATASNATINVTFNDGSSANLTAQAVGGTIRRGHMFSLTPLIPLAHQGKFIRGVNSVQLSASTGTAGNFGFTCTRPRATLPLLIANKQETADWAALGMPIIENDSCLQYVILPSTTSTGTIRGGGKIAHG